MPSSERTAPFHLGCRWGTENLLIALQLPFFSLENGTQSDPFQAGFGL